MKENKKALERLLPKQHDFYNRAIVLEKHQISLFEAPTGFGKSVIVNTIAETLAQNKKKVIIATATNQLAIELLNTFKDEKLDFDKKIKVDIVVGNGNYFDIQNITDEVYEYIDRKEMTTYIENIENNYDYMIERLFDTITIEEPHKKIVQDIISAKERIKGFSNFGDLDISFTNYHNLLTSVFYSKSIDLSEYIVIGDEVHQLVEIAEGLLTNSFSLYRMRSLTTALEKELVTAGSQSKSLSKMLDTQKSMLTSYLQEYSSPNKAGGFYTASAFDESSVVNKVKDSFIKKGGEEKKTPSFSEKLDKLINKEIKKLNSPTLRDAYKRYNSERREMLSVVTSPDAITVYLSPSKGYPTLNSAKGDVRGYLLTHLWDKVESFIGVSATIRVDEKDSGAFRRLGINRGTESGWETHLAALSEHIKTYGRSPLEREKDEVLIYEFMERQKKGYKEGWLTQEREDKIIHTLGEKFFYGLQKGEKFPRHIERVEHKKYGVVAYEPIFSKTQATTHLPPEDLIAPQKQGSLDEGYWLDTVATNIVNNHDGKNSLVLCGSFYEAEQISKRLQALLDETVVIHTAQRNTPALQIIERFKKFGGILIGTRNYGVGLNLPRKQLEKLFIVKIPFPIFTTKKWLDIKESDMRLGTSFYYPAYNAEMIKTLRQWIGRLIRTFDDRGEIYLLDSRYHKKRYKAKIEYWLDIMSVLSVGTIKTIAAQDGNTESYVEKKIVKVLVGIDCDSDIREYLLDEENLVHMAKNRNFPIPLNHKDKDFKKRMRDFRKKHFALLEDI